MWPAVDVDMDQVSPDAYRIVQDQWAERTLPDAVSLLLQRTYGEKSSRALRDAAAECLPQWTGGRLQMLLTRCQATDTDSDE